METISVVLACITILISVVGLVVSFRANHKAALSLKINIFGVRKEAFDFIIEIFDFLKYVEIDKYSTIAEFIRCDQLVNLNNGKYNIKELYEKSKKYKNSLPYLFKRRDIKFSIKIIRVFDIFIERLYNNNQLTSAECYMCNFLKKNCHNKEKAINEFSKYMDVSKIN